MSRELNGPRQHSADHSASSAGRDSAGRDTGRDSAGRDTGRDDALLHWDELDEQLLSMLAADPVRGKRLRKLQDADAWLRSRAKDAARRLAGPALLECPPAEDLYDFGQGPGATTLAAARFQAIDRHLATCAECEGFVGSLSSRPPSPMILDPLRDPVSASTSPLVAAEANAVPAPNTALPRLVGADAPSQAPVHSLPARRRGPMRIAGPLAAAAAILIAVVAYEHASAPSFRFPEPVVLRGADAGPILFPRGRVLVPSAELRALFPALGGAPILEVETQADATSYRFELARHTGGAFGTDTAVGAPIVSTEPYAPARAALSEGEYVLKVFVETRGIERSLSTRGFQLCRDEVLDARLRAFANLDASRRTMAALALLDECGYATDARALARTLPASPERDRYLASPRGR